MAWISLKADAVQKSVSWEFKGRDERPLYGSYHYWKYMIRRHMGVLVHEKPCGVQGPIRLEPAASRGAEDFPKVLGLWGCLAE
ncbi:hypothetical protein YC2023_083897 [Brassica napus]|uniref:Uncharacterized protein n=1 Tax=Brassica oleracea var. oleracea TaxID=109376 RepID=A0A0D3D7M6_BRAOL